MTAQVTESERTYPFTRKERRSYTEQKAALLAILREGPMLRTPLMYKANMSWAQLEAHMGELEANRFVVRVADPSGLQRPQDFAVKRSRRFGYAVTEEGVDALSAYELAAKRFA